MGRTASDIAKEANLLDICGVWMDEISDECIKHSTPGIKG